MVSWKMKYSTLEFTKISFSSASLFQMAFGLAHFEIPGSPLMHEFNFSSVLSDIQVSGGLEKGNSTSAWHIMKVIFTRAAVQRSGFFI